MANPEFQREISQARNRFRDLLEQENANMTRIEKDPTTPNLYRNQNNTFKNYLGLKTSEDLTRSTNSLVTTPYIHEQRSRKTATVTRGQQETISNISSERPSNATFIPYSHEQRSRTTAMARNGQQGTVCESSFRSTDHRIFIPYNPEQLNSSRQSEVTSGDRQATVSDIQFHLDSIFKQKMELTRTKRWCDAIPLARKTKTIQDFLRDFRDVETLATEHCVACYRQTASVDLRKCSWDDHEKRFKSTSDEFLAKEIFSCRSCFPKTDTTVSICQSCDNSFSAGSIPESCSVNNAYIGCEHRYPKELHQLSPIEEKLIGLNTAYAYVIKFSVDKTNHSGIQYRKHVRGHITVFPNDIEGLCSNILPHPLIKAMESIHVSWNGVRKPTPNEVTRMLKVRKSVVIGALQWLKRNNQLYSDISIAEQQIDLEYIEDTNVPTLLYETLQHVEPTVEETVAQSTINTQSPPISDTQAPMHETCDALLNNLINDGSHNDESAKIGLQLRSELNDEPHYENLEGCDEDECNADDVDFGSPLQNATSSAMLNLDNPSSGHNPAIRWHFIQNALADTPYIQASRNTSFADSLDPDFFPKTFPTLFPYGVGGPKGLSSVPTICVHKGKFNSLWYDENREPERYVHSESACEACSARCQPAASMYLKKWTTFALHRHGGRFACHPIFCFLAFNMLLRSNINRISMIKMSPSNYSRAQRLFRSLTIEKLQNATNELQATNQTSDAEVKQLLTELSLFFFSQPLSNESRLQMRKKIRALCIQNGLPGIWFTINPNDITNDVKLRLAICREASSTAYVDKVLNNMQHSSQYRNIIEQKMLMDPVSSVIFFQREVVKFFQHYVRPGEDSIFGRISHYYATVETNNRGALHLHGLMWLEGNLDLPQLCKIVREPEQSEYKNKVIQYVDHVFSENLDYASGRTVSMSRTLQHLKDGFIQNDNLLQEDFDTEANFVAFKTQIHEHSATCLKYHVRKLKTGSQGSTCNEYPICRFHAPWPLVETTNFNEDGILKVARNFSMVNRYNKSMAIGLRHNHDISMILSKSYSLSMVYYITNYATKLETPTWKRVALAEEVLQIIQQQEEEEYSAQREIQNREQPSLNQQTSIKSPSIRFLQKLANKITVERSVSAVEVCNHLLGFETDFTNTPRWAFINCNTLYWSVLRYWKALQDQAICDGMIDLTPNIQPVTIHQFGKKISMIEAYKNRGALLRKLCLYDYLSCVQIFRRKGNQTSSRWIPFEASAESCSSMIQYVTSKSNIATVVLDGKLTNKFEEKLDGVYYQRDLVLHFALFIPWEDFLEKNANELLSLWILMSNNLCARLQFYVENISLLQKSRDDAAAETRSLAEQNLHDDNLVIAEFGEQQEVLQEESLQDNDFLRCRRHLKAFGGILNQSVQPSEITARSKHIGSALQQIDALNEDFLKSYGQPTTLRNGQFYNQLEQNPLIGIGIGNLNLEQIQTLSKSQKKANQQVLDRLLGYDNASTTLTSETNQSTISIGPDANTTIAMGTSWSYLDAALLIQDIWKTNKIQTQALLQPFEFLDRREANQIEQDQPQYFMYLGGAGGTGKSRVVSSIRDVFRVKSCESKLLLTASSGSAAAKIQGVTIHSALGIAKVDTNKHHTSSLRNSDRGTGTRSFSEKQLKDAEAWKARLMLVIDEISMISGSMLHEIDQKCRYLGDRRFPFGGIPVVIFTGDFYQFPPVQGLSLMKIHGKSVQPLFSEPYLESHFSGYKLFQKFTNVVILREQVRAGSCPILRGFLSRLRNGMQTVEDYDMLQTKIKKGQQRDFTNGMRAITSTNRQKLFLNIEAAFQWARCCKKHVSIFISNHVWTKESKEILIPSDEQMLSTLFTSDNSRIKIPPFFIYVSGTPVMTTENNLLGLKYVNGAEFNTVSVVPDSRYPGYCITDDMTLHFGPPAGLLVTSEDIRHVQVPGLETGTLLITPKQIKLPRDTNGLICYRTGLPCVPSFAITAHKAQGSSFSNILVDLLSSRMHKSQPLNQQVSSASSITFESLYVQLSRATSWDGIAIAQNMTREKFLECRIDRDIEKGLQKLENLSNTTLLNFDKLCKETDSPKLRRWYESFNQNICK